MRFSYISIITCHSETTEKKKQSFDDISFPMTSFCAKKIKKSRLMSEEKKNLKH